MAEPTMDWMPQAYRNQRLSNSPFDTYDHPKGLLHTSEGFSIETSENACANGGFDPHFTIGPDPNRPNHVKIVQHYPLTSRATALENDEITGGQTNRQAVWQVELIGVSDPRYKTHRQYVLNWADWYLDGIAKWMQWMEATCGIPHVATPLWTPYPDSYGLHAPQRMSWDTFTHFSGWVGHEHAAGNVHGDPGNLDVRGKLLSRYTLKPVIEPAPVPVPRPAPAPDPEPTPKDDEVLGYRTLAKDAKPYGLQSLPTAKYATLALGRDAKGDKLISLLTAGDGYKPGSSFKARLDLVLKTKSKPDHIEVLFYVVDTSTKVTKVARVYKVQAPATFHTKGLYRVHVQELGWLGGKNERIRVQVRSDWKNVNITDVSYAVEYTKDEASK